LFQSFTDVAARKFIEDVQSFVAVTGHFFMRVGNAAGLYNLINYRLYFLFVPVIVFNDMDKSSTCDFINVVKRIYKRQGKLFLLNVIARWFADFLTTIIKQVIFDLEGNACFFSKSPHFLSKRLVTGG